MRSKSNTKKSSGKVVKIAVVDDHHLFRAGIMALLKDYPEFQVIVQASNGIDLLNQLKKHKPQLILLDIEMPEMDGIQTTIKLKENYPNMKIIILTQHIEEGFIFDLINKGVNGFLQKDKSLETLVEAIRKVMDTGSYYTEEIMEAMIKGNKSKYKKPLTNSALDLSEREKEIIKFMCTEKSHKEIADELNVSARTIDAHRDAIYQKTKIKNKAGLVLYAIKHHLISNTKKS